LFKPDTSIYSNDGQTNNGYFAFFRTGIDYFVDNRNTITVNGSYQNGNFKTDGLQTIDSSNTSKYSTTDRTTYTGFEMKNFGGQLSYKHNFADNGHSLSADINYNYSKNNRNSDIGSYNIATPTNTFQQNTIGKGLNKFLTVQTDYENK